MDSQSLELEELKALAASPASYTLDPAAQGELMAQLLTRVKSLGNYPGLNDLALFQFARPFLVDREKELRVAALRLFRHLCSSPESFVTASAAKLEYFVVRAFEAEGRSQERIEACKFLMHWLEVSPGNFPRALVQALTALTEDDKDEFRELALEALRVLSITNTPLVAASGGFKILISSALDQKAAPGLSENIVYTLLYLLNEQHTRKYLKIHKEIARILAVFTNQDTALKEEELDAQLRMARKALVLMSRSWVGLIFLASAGLKELIESLCYPVSDSVKEGILDTITDMLNIPVESSLRTYNLLNNYHAMQLRALLHCNLHPALSQLSVAGHGRVQQKARKLLRAVTKSASDLIPESAQFPLAPHSEMEAAEPMAELDSSVRSCECKSFLNSSCEFVSFESLSGVSSVNWVLNGIYKQHTLSLIDDNLFLGLLSRSNVARDYTRWDWDLVFEAVAGPISQPNRFQQASKSRFLKNLLSFYTPSKRLFAGLPWHPSEFIKARVGSLLTALLLSSDEGVQILSSAYSESFFVNRKSYMGELTDAIDEEVRVLENEQANTARVFTPEAMRGQMAREYFKWLAQFTTSRNGRKLLKTFGIDVKLMRLAAVEHLSPVLMPHLDYKEQISRNFLSFALQARTLLVTKNAMEQIRTLYRAGGYELSWAIRELVNHLYSPDYETVLHSISVLDELCQSEENLSAFIHTQPQTLTKLGEPGKECLLRFLSSFEGIEYLKNFDYIENELVSWTVAQNLDYVKKIELMIETGLNSPQKNHFLTLPTPAAQHHSELLEASWIRQLPFTLKIASAQHSLLLQPTIEIEDNEIYMVVRLDCFHTTDSVAVCCVLGTSYLDHKGRESGEEQWVKCSHKAQQEHSSIETQGVTFKFNSTELVSVSCRLQILPRAAPAVQFPKHLYGELARTPKGVQHLREGHIAEGLLSTLAAECPVLEKRAALWGLGHIGSTTHGIEYLNTLQAVHSLIAIAEKSTVLSLRGTAVQSLSLIAKTRAGAVELAKFGWSGSDATHGAIAVPDRPESVFWIEAQAEGDFIAESADCIEHVLDSITLTAEEREVFEHCVGLAKVPNNSESDAFLRAKRVQAPSLFQGIGLYYSVMVLLAGYSFRLKHRKLIHKLFERISRVQGQIAEIDLFSNFPN